MNQIRELQLIFDLLYDRYGPQHWWPGETRDEIIIGAILTQNTNWKNVEKAITNLKAENLLSLTAIAQQPLDMITQCIKPSGYYNQKALSLKAVAEFFHHKDIEKYIQRSLTHIRDELLSIKGIGPETADSILLYAFEKPIFIIDAYTKRIFQRLGYLAESSYEDTQSFFMNNLNKGAKYFNEYHALIVHHAKECCQKIPTCTKCILINKCKYKNKRI